MACWACCERRPVRVLRDQRTSGGSPAHDLADGPAGLLGGSPRVPRYAAQNPIANYFLRTRDGRATRFSDLITRRELHRLELYRQVYEPLAIEYQIAFTLPSGAERILGVSLSRSKRNFSAAERDLLNLARPYLIQAYRNALDHTDLMRASATSVSVAALRPLGLTERQAQVLRLIAMGYTSEHAAIALGIGVPPRRSTSSTATARSTSTVVRRRLAWPGLRCG